MFFVVSCHHAGCLFHVCTLKGPGERRPISEWTSFWEQSSTVSWFSPLDFHDVSGMDLGCTRICAFERNLCNLERASRFWLSAQMNSWANFCHSSIYFLQHLSKVLRVNPLEFRERWVNLRKNLVMYHLMAASFHFFISVACSKKKAFTACFETELISFFCFNMQAIKSVAQTYWLLTPVPNVFFYYFRFYYSHFFPGRT